MARKNEKIISAKHRAECERYIRQHKTITYMEEKATQIQKAYMDYISLEGKRPVSVHAFMVSLDLEEGDFYQHYGSFSALESSIFLGFFQRTKALLESGEEYQSFSSREKILSFFYTYVGVLQQRRSFIQYIDEHTGCLCIGENYMSQVKEPFISYVRKIIKEGIESDEIADRWLVTRWYRNMVWGQAVAILKFWIRDTSANFEQTDVLIEKGVNFFFDLIEPNALDSGFDLAKFLFRNL